MTEYLMVVIGAVFVHNFILSKFLGLCPFLGVSKNTRQAVGMGLAVIFVMTMASIITWVVYNFVLIPFNITYLRTIAFILIIASFVQFVEIVIRKISPALFRAFGIYLTLITTNCAIMGVAVLNSDMFFKDGKAAANSFFLSVLQGFSAGVGFLLALFLMSAIRERLELLDIPEAFKGVPIAFIVAALMSLAFLGFAGFRI
ncbi:MAG: electron transport complex subunit RsxA [Candidatus Omnitrophota bacterium]